MISTIPANGLQAVLAGICAVSFLYFGLYIASPALRERKIRPLLYMCFFSSIWCFSYVMYFLTPDGSSRQMWQGITFAGMLAFVFPLWFILGYTDAIRNKRIAAVIYIALWIPPLVSAYMSISENSVANDFPHGFWFLFVEIQTTVYNLASIACVVTYHWRTKTNKSGRQAVVLSISALFLMTLSWLADYYFGFRGTQNLIPFWILIWIGVILFTIKKYRFISITPDFIGRDIAEHIEEGIVLLDPGLRVMFANSSLHRLANAMDNHTRDSLNFLDERDYLKSELKRMAGGEGESLKIQGHINQPGDGPGPAVDIAVKKIIDPHGDLSGFLVIVSRLKDLGLLRNRFNVTARETDIIRQLAVGRTNREISRHLGITESTVETHITSIYQKLGTKNRVELVNTLAEYNVPGLVFK